MTTLFLNIEDTISWQHPAHFPVTSKQEKIVLQGETGHRRTTKEVKSPHRRLLFFYEAQTEKEIKHNNPDYRLWGIS